MGTTPDNNLRFDVPDVTLDDNTWGGILNTLISEMERAVTAIHSQAFVASNVTILADGSTSDEARRAILVGTGALSGNVNFVVPNEPKIYIIFNNTTNAFTLGIKTSAGTRLDVPQGDTLIVYCDGSDGFFQINAIPSGTIAQATNADKLTNVVGANFGQKAVKNSWTKPQIVVATQAVLTLANPKTYTPNVDSETSIIVSQAEMDRDTNPLKFENPTGTPVDGQSLVFMVEQSATGALGLTWGTKYLFPDSVDANLTLTINKVDSFAFMYNANLVSWMNFGTALNMPRS